MICAWSVGFKIKCSVTCLVKNEWVWDPKYHRSVTPFQPECVIYLGVCVNYHADGRLDFKHSVSVHDTFMHIEGINMA